MSETLPGITGQGMVATTNEEEVEAAAAALLPAEVGGLLALGQTTVGVLTAETARVAPAVEGIPQFRLHQELLVGHRRWETAIVEGVEVVAEAEAIAQTDTNGAVTYRRDSDSTKLFLFKVPSALEVWGLLVAAHASIYIVII